MITNVRREAIEKRAAEFGFEGEQRGAAGIDYSAAVGFVYLRSRNITVVFCTGVSLWRGLL